MTLVAEDEQMAAQRILADDLFGTLAASALPTSYVRTRSTQIRSDHPTRAPVGFRRLALANDRDFERLGVARSGKPLRP